MHPLHILWYLITGFFIGLIARAIVPGNQHMGLLATTILGIVGSFIGGFIGSMIWKQPEGTKFHRAGFLLSIVGAIILIILWGLISR